MTLPSADELAVPPRLVARPAEISTTESARACIDFAETYGLELDDWQRWWISNALAEQADGRWSALEAAIVCARQNGKNSILEAIELSGIYLFDEKLIVHSAHQFSTSQEHFLRLKSLIEGSYELSRKLYPRDRSFVTANGKEAIRFTNGARILFKARSRASARGFVGDRIVFDEAFDLPAAAIGAMMPTLTTRPHGQVIYASSHPHYGSDVLHGLLRRAKDRSEDDRRFFLGEWGNDSDAKLDDPAIWRRANPAWGVRVNEEFVRTEWMSMRSDPLLIGEFSREICGIPEGGDGTAGVVPYQQWLKLAIPNPSQMDSVTFGLAVAPDATWSAVGSAGRLPNGHLYVDNVKFLPGTSQVVGYLAETLWPKKRIPIRIDPSDAGGAFIRPLRDAGVEVIEVAGREYSQACGELLTAVTDGKVRHIDQECLNRAAAAAAKREVGREGGWVWARSGSVDISPLKAATLALSGVEKKRKPRIHVWEQR